MDGWSRDRVHISNSHPTPTSTVRAPANPAGVECKQVLLRAGKGKQSSRIASAPEVDDQIHDHDQSSANTLNLALPNPRDDVPTETSSPN